MTQARSSWVWNSTEVTIPGHWATLKGVFVLESSLGHSSQACWFACSKTRVWRCLFQWISNLFGLSLNPSSPVGFQELEFALLIWPKSLRVLWGVISSRIAMPSSHVNTSCYLQALSSTAEAEILIFAIRAVRPGPTNSDHSKTFEACRIQ